MCLSTLMSVQMPEGVRSHGAGITEGCETPLPLTNVGARNQTGLLCKFSCCCIISPAHVLNFENIIYILIYTVL